MSINAIPDPPPDRTSTEPAMKVAGYTTAVTLATAFVGLLLAFGVGLTDRQGNAIVGVVIAVVGFAPVASGWFTRSRVYAPATVAKMIDATVAKTLDEAQAEQAPPTSALRWPAK